MGWDHECAYSSGPAGHILFARAPAQALSNKTRPVTRAKHHKKSAAADLAQGSTMKLIDLPFNKAPAQIMHIDLNSCFAIIEQQANPLIRHKPVAVAAYDSPGGMVIASSYEAKAKGIKLGVNVREARQLAQDVVVLTPDPAKYREAHRRFKEVLLEYTSDVNPRSIDEFVIDFTGSNVLQQGRSLVDVGYEIKEKIKQRLGSYVTVNVGIGTNRFWAKTAAGLNKPDGLDVMTAANALAIYETMQLTDITGINVRYEARLNAHGIFTPVQFFNSTADYLKKQVFRSVVGWHWYGRLRGWEMDAVEWGRKSFGHQYALGKKTDNREELAKLLMKLCEKTGRRLRNKHYMAGGVHLSLSFEDRTRFAHGRQTRAPVYATQDIYRHAMRLLNEANIFERVIAMSVSVYGLTPTEPVQMGLFDATRLDNRAIADTCDVVNDRYGEFTIAPALMAEMDEVILDRIAFGGVRDLDD